MSRLVASCALLVAALPSQDLALVGGRVWTGVQGRSEAEAVLIRGNRIRAVGTDEAVRAQAAGATVIPLEGRRVVPGLVDSHVHFLQGCDEILTPDFRSATSEEEFVRRVGEFAKTQPTGQWLTGGTWDHENWPGATLPTREMLDRYVPDHPVFIERLDGHMAVANSLAIERAKLRENVPAPIGGEIVRDADGRLAGVFKDSAMVLISRHVPRRSREDIVTALRAGLGHAAEFGVTGVHDMLGGWDVFGAWQELRDRGELTLRVTVYTPIADVERWRAVRVRRGFGDDYLAVNGCKGFVDGSLGSTTAWFFEPYTDAPETSGLPMAGVLDSDDLAAGIERCLLAGLQPAIHAIGDRANRYVLDVFAKWQPAEREALRPRIEHAQHLHPDDIARFARLGVVASMQPYHAIDDGRWAGGRIGDKRSDTTYAFKDLAESGATLAFGSDWPVAPLSPWRAIEGAVTRERLDGEGPYVARQRIDVETALRAYTGGSTFAAHDDGELGTIEVGKLADLVVLDRDPLTIEPDQISEVRVLRTIVGGVTVFQRQ